MRAKKSLTSQLRSFGLVVGAGFAVVGLWPTVFRLQPPRWWALILWLVLSTLAVVRPQALVHVHRVWMTLGEALGWLNSRIILGVVYYLLIVPTGLIRRVTGHDSMRRTIEPGASTYKVPSRKRPAVDMLRQY